MSPFNAGTDVDRCCPANRHRLTASACADDWQSTTHYHRLKRRWRLTLTAASQYRNRRRCCRPPTAGADSWVRTLTRWGGHGATPTKCLPHATKTMTPLWNRTSIRNHTSALVEDQIANDSLLGYNSPWPLQNPTLWLAEKPCQLVQVFRLGCQLMSERQLTF